MVVAPPGVALSVVALPRGGVALPGGSATRRGRCLGVAVLGVALPGLAPLG